MHDTSEILITDAPRLAACTIARAIVRISPALRRVAGSWLPAKASLGLNAFELCRIEMICTPGATPENPSAAGAGGAGAAAQREPVPVAHQSDLPGQAPAGGARRCRPGESPACLPATRSRPHPPAAAGAAAEAQPARSPFAATAEAAEPQLSAPWRAVDPGAAAAAASCRQRVVRRSKMPRSCRGHHSPTARRRQPRRSRRHRRGRSAADAG